MLGFEEMNSSCQKKCDSTFQPSTPAMLSSASLEPMAQMKINSSHCLYPRVAHGLRSKFVGGMQGPVYLTFRYSNNHGSDHTDAGNSFLALLYGRPSLLHCDFQELSDPKHCTLSGNFTAASGNFVDSVGSGAFLTSSGGMITENLSNHNLQTWADTFPYISSRGLVGMSSNSSVLHEPTVPGGEKVREPLSSRGQCCGTSPAYNPNVCSSDIQAMPNMALGQCSSKQATPFMDGCPRVFCMCKRILGIVCSCHCCCMSVLKFCEHSGLHAVNLGDVVCMESGETIAQWRKLYLLKFGICSITQEQSPS